MRAIRLYLSFAKVNIREAMAHRATYWAGIVGQWCGYGATFATLYIMVSRFDMLGGWTADQVLFMYAVNLLSYALAATFFFRPTHYLAGKIRTGEFDSALTKPVSPFAHEVYMGFNFGYVSHVTLSIAVMVVTGIRVGLAVTPLSLLTLLLAIVGATLVQAAVMVAASSASFFMFNHNPFFTLSWNIKDFCLYPISIYNTAIQVILTFVLPVAFASFYPAAAVLGVTEGLFSPRILGLCTPLVGLLLLWLSIRLWNWGLSKYQSAGS